MNLRFVVGNLDFPLKWGAIEVHVTDKLLNRIMLSAVL